MTKKRFICLTILKIATVFTAVVILLCLLSGCTHGNGNIDESGQPTDNVSETFSVDVENVTVTYDGNGHAVIIKGSKENDKVFYSTDGVSWSILCPFFTDVGKHEVYVKVERSGCVDYFTKAYVEITKCILDGITAPDIRVIYDGHSHSIKMFGIQDGDAITYSIDGENFSSELALVEPGEYTVYFRVDRAYGYFADSCKVTVVPDIRGTYVGCNGIITVDGDTDYGIDCSWSEDGIEYRYEDGHVITSGGVYSALGNDESIYTVSTGDETVYAAAKDVLEVEISFEDGGAEIRFADRSIEVDGVNYVENIKVGNIDLKPERSYYSSDISFEVEHIGEITEINIRFSMRKVPDKQTIEKYVLYDGEEHSAIVETDGETVVIGENSFIDPGKYSVEIIVLEEDCLPCIVNAVLTIHERLDGVYYSDSEIVEIDGESVFIDGVEHRLSVSASLTIGDKTVCKSTNGIVIGDSEYAEAKSRLLAVRCGGKQNILAISEEVYNLFIFIGDDIGIYADDFQETLLIKIDQSLSTPKVTVGGVELVAIPPDEWTPEWMVIVGENELTSDIITIEIAES